MVFVIVTGNPVDGFEYIGPFASGDDAIVFATKTTISDDWWTARLFSPKEYGEKDDAF